MGMLMVAIGIGFFGSFLVFFIAEEMSLKDADFSDIKDAFTKELSLEDSQKILKMVEEFEDLDDVQNVYHNLELSDELMQSMDE